MECLLLLLDLLLDFIVDLFYVSLLVSLFVPQQFGLFSMLMRHFPPWDLFGFECSSLDVRSVDLADKSCSFLEMALAMGS